MNIKKNNKEEKDQPGVSQDLQSGELAHVGEGRVGQWVDLVVAQVPEGGFKKWQQLSVSMCWVGY